MSELYNDVNRYICVYKNNVSTMLHKSFPKDVADMIETKLDVEFDEFQSYLLERIKRG